MLSLNGSAQAATAAAAATPADTETIMREIAQFDQVRPPRREVAHDIRWLSAGHVFEL